jgi:hypothetical protein
MWGAAALLLYADSKEREASIESLHFESFIQETASVMGKLSVSETDLTKLDY